MSSDSPSGLLSNLDNHHYDCDDHDEDNCESDDSDDDDRDDFGMRSFTSPAKFLTRVELCTVRWVRHLFNHSSMLSVDNDDDDDDYDND